MNVSNNKLYHATLFLVASLLLSFNTFSSPKAPKDSPRRNHNVCKKLKGRVLVYVIMAETKESSQWDDYDITTTKDSINNAVKWIQQQAQINNIDVNFDVQYYRNDTAQYVGQNLNGSFKKLLSKPEGVLEVNKWADKIVKKATGLKNRERLIAKLRDEYSTESVVLLFMVNNYYRTGFSYSINTSSDLDVEYSIISSKEPSVISSEIISLFGGFYFYHHPSVSDKKNRDKLKEIFPYDIMALPDKPLQQLYIGDITKYSIGWADEVNVEYEKMIEECKSKY